MTDNTSNIRVLIFPENNIWVMECLEYDLAGEGKDLKEAQKSFCKMFVSQILIDKQHSIEPLSMSIRNEKDKNDLIAEYQESANNPAKTIQQTALHYALNIAILYRYTFQKIAITKETY